MGWGSPIERESSDEGRRIASPEEEEGIASEDEDRRGGGWSVGEI